MTPTGDLPNQIVCTNGVIVYADGRMHLPTMTANPETIGTTLGHLSAALQASRMFIAVHLLTKAAELLTNQGYTPYPVVYEKGCGGSIAGRSLAYNPNPRVLWGDAKQALPPDSTYYNDFVQLQRTLWAAPGLDLTRFAAPLVSLTAVERRVVPDPARKPVKLPQIRAIARCVDLLMTSPSVEMNNPPEITLDALAPALQFASQDPEDLAIEAALKNAVDVAAARRRYEALLESNSDSDNPWLEQVRERIVAALYP